MLDSRVLETTIGLCVVFAAVSVAASLIVESASRFFRVRATMLEHALRAPDKALRVLDRTQDDPHGPSTEDLRPSPKAVLMRDGRHWPSYLTPAAGRARLQVGRPDLTDADADAAFEELNARLGEIYKRWATMALFMVGLAIAVLSNVSALDVAHRLWNDETARQQLVALGEAADTQADFEAKIAEVCAPEKTTVAPALTEHVHDWLCAGREGRQRPQWTWSNLLGWLIMAGATVLGAQFWFDLVGRFVSLRPTKPGTSTPGVAA